MLATLPENAVELDGYLMGPTTDIMVEDVDFGTADIVQSDKQLPRSDGIRFGRDFRGGRVITVSLQLFGPTGEDTVRMVNELAERWNADETRAVPGATSVLRWRSGNHQRRAYGRPRRFAPVSTRANANWAPIVADFQCVDHRYYSDVEESNTVSIVPPDVGGFFEPFVWPLTSVAISYAPGVITVGGNGPAWPVYVIRGPIADPVIRIVGEFEVPFPGLVLKSDETLVVDTRPWSRGIRRNNTVSLPGALSATSPRLSNLYLKPGGYEIILRGSDLTGTASMTVAWREVFASF